MSGITSTLSIAKTAIAAQQYGLNVTGHNIANVNNPDYSRQDAKHISHKPALYAGFLFGTGVNVTQIQQSVDLLLENRLTDEKSTQAMFEEAESYMKVLEGFFDENSQASMNSIISDYWNSWHDLSDNPLGVSERVQIYEKGKKLAEQFNSLRSDLDQVSLDITYEINATLTTINSLATQIADLNREIIGLEANRTANDLRDQRNSLVDQLGVLINVNVITQGNGALIINGANGSTLVNGVDSYSLTMKSQQVMWQGSFGSTSDITDDISGGKLGGWLEIRDEIIPKYRAQMDELAREMIWAVNYQNSQGAGLEYYTETVTGSYSVDESGWLSSFNFGDKIDYSKDLTMWTQDHSSAEIEYRKILMDMGVSQASLSNWQGMAPGADQARYKLTVVDEGDIGDKIVTQTNGDRLAEIWGTSSGGASTALDNVMANQTLTIYGSSTGTHNIDIKDSGGDAKRSAASIAAALNAVDGVTAYASKTQAEFDISGISNAQNGDEVQYSLYVDGYVYAKSFIVDSSVATLAVQFEDSLVEAVNAINSMNLDTDLYADGLKFSSDKGATLGVQDFEVQDNAGIQLDTFSNFNNTDTVTLKITSDGIPSTSTDVLVDLTGVSDVTDQAEISRVFYNAIIAAVANEPFTVEWGTTANSILIRSTDGSNITLREAGNDTGDDATINLTSLSGSSSAAGNTSFEFTAGATDVETFNSLTTSGDTVTFGMPSTITTAVTGTSAVITEGSYTGAAATTSAIISGTITALLDSGMSIQSDTMTGTGLFGTAGTATTGSSIITLGGEDGFTGFDAGDTISFDVDGNTVSFIVSAGAGTTEAGLALQLYNELNSDISSTDYTFIRNGKSVSIIKSATLEDPIEITSFSDSAGNDAKLAVSTGTGDGASDPENDLLESGNTYRDFTTGSLYVDEAIIRWERFDENGDSTGASGLLTIEDVGTVAIVENGSQTVFFDISKGSLVAGNTLTINTDTAGGPDPVDFRVFRQAKSINDIYHFKVTSGGKVGHVPATGVDNLTIEWHSSVSSGTFEIKGHTPPRTPTAAIEIEVDGMILNFYDGTLFEGDVFTITTDESGIPLSSNSTGQATGEFMSDWHWTLDSFKDQFNKKAGGMKASVTLGNQLKMQSSDNYFDIENVEYSGSNGFSPENTAIEVLDWTALNFKGLDFQFVRSSGRWGILNDTTGGVARIIPAGGDDDGFMVDLNGDGVGDININFAKKVTGDGYVRFDLLKHNANDIRYAFGDDASTGSGIMAAAGINTFFKGSDAVTMEINENLSDTKYIVSGKIDSKTGAITQGDNENALAMSDIQHQSMTMKHWEFNRGFEAQSSIIESTLDDYYNTMIGTLGVKARSIKTSREFADIMVNQMTEQRDAVSAVSLDEEMIKLIKYQHAFSAASKLLTVADEMLTTLISVR
ncbi:MAG: flagellar hook-associated protein FlgK [Desulfobacula sp.]|uniref:flagellar hook-associated protein FlgK n=1 Tax=Desulfobacula sp. TaxID=2593537 RepID=UPI0025C1CCE5|nr:flagellar hook-associated protein FlgK [Desulfobacula sp.]MCD4720739.1 flagellar hook-associated protein FlgK [Desulfobacula sp.]